MALQKSVTTKHDIVLPTAYIQVIECKLNYVQRRAWITTYTYKDIKSRKANKEPLEKQEYRVYSEKYEEFFAITTPGSTPINSLAESYNYLKSLAEFAGAIDVLEEVNPLLRDPEDPDSVIIG